MPSRKSKNPWHKKSRVDKMVGWQKPFSPPTAYRADPKDDFSPLQRKLTLLGLKSELLGGETSQAVTREHWKPSSYLKFSFGPRGPAATLPAVLRRVVDFLKSEQYKLDNRQAKGPGETAYDFWIGPNQDRVLVAKYPGVTGVVQHYVPWERTVPDKREQRLVKKSSNAALEEASNMAKPKKQPLSSARCQVLREPRDVRAVERLYKRYLGDKDMSRLPGVLMFMDRALARYASESKPAPSRRSEQGSMRDELVGLQVEDDDHHRVQQELDEQVEEHKRRIRKHGPDDDILPDNHPLYNLLSPNASLLHALLEAQKRPPVVATAAYKLEGVFGDEAMLAKVKELTKNEMNVEPTICEYHQGSNTVYMQLPVGEVFPRAPLDLANTLGEVLGVAIPIVKVGGGPRNRVTLRYMF